MFLYEVGGRGTKMLYTEEDIDFNLLSSTLFEELCFDLLTRLGFQSLKWRQGGADSGRDIEAKLLVSNPLVGHYLENWFFECKNYSGGVSPDKLDSKFAWADVEKPNHLVFIMASYPTNPCREWLEKKQSNVDYRVHLVEGKQLKSLVLLYDDLVERYFLNQSERLFRNAFVDWIASGVFADPKRLVVFSKEIDAERLNLEELAFLLTSFCEEASERQALENKDNIAIDFPLHIQRGYSLAQAAEGSILDEVVCQFKGELAVAYLNQEPWSMYAPVLYEKDKLVYEGSYVCLRHNQEFYLEILLGRVVSTGEVDANIHLVQLNHLEQLYKDLGFHQYLDRMQTGYDKRGFLVTHATMRIQEETKEE
jgi:hypothetical protein